jgi:ketosteroid isomerase-like protein
MCRQTTYLALLGLAVLSLGGRSAGSDTQAGRPPDTDANKALVRRYYDALNSGLSANNWSAASRDFAAIDRLFAPHYVRHVSSLTREPEHLAAGAVTVPADPRTLLKLFAIGLRANVSGGAYSVEDQIAEGDRVVTRWGFRGTAKSGTEDHGAPGKPVTMTGVEIYQVRGGKIVESWGITNVSDLPTLKLPLDQW